MYCHRTVHCVTPRWQNVDNELKKDPYDAPPIDADPVLECNDPDLSPVWSVERDELILEDEAGADESPRSPRQCSWQMAAEDSSASLTSFSSSSNLDASTISSIDQSTSSTLGDSPAPSSQSSVLFETGSSSTSSFSPPFKLPVARPSEMLFTPELRAPAQARWEEKAGQREDGPFKGEHPKQRLKRLAKKLQVSTTDHRREC